MKIRKEHRWSTKELLELASKVNYLENSPEKELRIRDDREKTTMAGEEQLDRSDIVKTAAENKKKV